MTIRKTKDTMTASLGQVQKRLDQLPQVAQEQFVRLTPRRSGQAQRSTRLSGDTIHASYPYATQLDSGSSDQAPQGMSQPTSRYLTAWARTNIRK